MQEHSMLLCTYWVIVPMTVIYKDAGSYGFLCRHNVPALNTITVLTMQIAQQRMKCCRNTLHIKYCSINIVKSLETANVQYVITSKTTFQQQIILSTGQKKLRTDEPLHCKTSKFLARLFASIQSNS